MNTIKTDGWTQQGVSLLWDISGLEKAAQPSDIVSFRQFLKMQKSGEYKFSASNGKSLVVVGLEGCLDTLNPADAQSWLYADAANAIFNFQDSYQDRAGLIFWLPGGRQRILTSSTGDEYFWLCAAPNADQRLPIGQLLFGGAQSELQRIVKENSSDYDGNDWMGLYIRRIS